MDNRIVLELIKKDLEELKILVEALMHEPFPDQMLVDITTTKAKTLYQEFFLLQGKKNDQSIEMKDIESEVEKLSQHEQSEFTSLELNEVVRHGNTKLDPLKEPFSMVENETIQTDAELDEHSVEDTNELITAFVKKEVPGDKTITAPEPVHAIVASTVEPRQEVLQTGEAVIEQIAEKTEAVLTEKESNSISIDKKILGERFTKEPSLNDRLANGNLHESKIKGKPITNLKKAIGLNDQFMFTRELFGNDQNKFELSINRIDQCASLIQAIEYLEQNFKWAKNATSLKFMEMVKKRFDH